MTELAKLSRLAYTKKAMLSAADREIRLGIWKIHILHHAAAREVWGTWLLEELGEHGHRLSPGTLYPALARMERNGWLERSGEAPHARARQTFRITSEGRRLLAALRRDVSELYVEIVLGQAHAKKSPTEHTTGGDTAECAPRKLAPRRKTSRKHS
jgi:PadR family transcriptional regulator PadR